MIPEGHVGSLVHQTAVRETGAVHVKYFQLTSDLMSAAIQKYCIMITTATIDHTITITTVHYCNMLHSPSIPPTKVFSLNIYSGPKLANYNSAFSMNSLHHCWCYKPAAYCSKPRDHVYLLKKLGISHMLRPVFQRLIN